MVTAIGLSAVLALALVLFLLGSSENGSKLSRSRATDAAPFRAENFKLEAKHNGDCLLSVNMWGSPTIRGLGSVALPDPVAVVVYGSAVRSGARARDVDILWLVDDDVSLSDCNAWADYYTDDGYGASASRWDVFHVAVCSTRKLHEQLTSGAEWATTLVHDGVLLAGDAEAGGVEWARTWERYQNGSFPGLRPVQLRHEGQSPAKETP